ncbi:MAG: glycosyl hydrolase family 8 [Candidatus Saccharibacteria bacterium]
MSLKPLRQFFVRRTEWIVGLLALAASSFMLGRVLNLNLLKVLTDENAHLNFSRALFDSTTPGISQIGFWPPLLHLLLAPFTAIAPLYRTGLAGAIVLIPFFVAGTVFLYRLVVRLTGNRALAFFATLLFIANPYILYYSVVPMMEILFLSNLFAVAYFMVCWLQEDRLKYLLWAAIFTALAGLSRYEGFALIPVLMVIFVLQTFFKRKSRSELQANVIIFLFIAIVGVVAVMGYSWFYSGNPLSFAGGAWIRDPFEAIFPTKHNIVQAANYFLHASYYMIGQPLVYLSLASFALLLFFLRKRFDAIAALLITLSPVAMILFAVYTGSYSISVPDLPPITIFLNERYALTWIGFIVLTPVLLAAYLIQAARGTRWLRGLSVSAASFLVTAAVCFTFGHFYSEAYQNKLQAVSLNSNRPLGGQIAAADYLKNHYDYGKILITRADNDPVLSGAGVPLKDYIYEGNYLYYGQALNEPWLFARWVVMHNPDDHLDLWAQQNEALARKWGNSQEFNYYYTLVSSNDIRQVYKINDARVETMARQENLNLSQIPSINRGISYWDPQNIYDHIRQPGYAEAQPSQSGKTKVDFLQMMGLKAFDLFGMFKTRDPSAKDSVKDSLVNLYWTDLKPDYSRGFFVDQNRQGTSESQSYALLQSYWAGDKQTFGRVWDWTQGNIRRPGDNLFSWKFTATPGSIGLKRRGIMLSVERTYSVKIEDTNSATDADSDIAYALLLAGAKWNRPDYTEAGRLIASDIYENETGIAAGQRLLTAGNWADSNGKLYYNPSYFAPYEYRLFRQYDPGHDWNKLISDNYQVLGRVLTNGPLSQYRLPPNWVVVDKQNGSFSTFMANADADNYTYDAFRTFWRIALDQIQTPSQEAGGILAQASVFGRQYAAGRNFCTIYQKANGSYQCQFAENLLASPLSVFSTTDQEQARRLVNDFYVSDNKLALPEDTFFSRSWHWFGLALYGAS